MTAMTHLRISAPVPRDIQTHGPIDHASSLSMKVVTGAPSAQGHKPSFSSILSGVEHLDRLAATYHSSGCGVGPLPSTQMPRSERGERGIGVLGVSRPRRKHARDRTEAKEPLVSMAVPNEPRAP